MRYKIRISGKERELDITPSKDEYRVQFPEGEFAIKTIERNPSSITAEVGGRVYTVRQLTRTMSSVSFIMNGKLVEASIGGKSREAARSSIASVSELVSSNFPARVVSVKAKAGDRLVGGDTLIILEAMKMEAQIKVPSACQVVSIFVKDGEMVEKGKPLARLSFD
ncbi:MAG: hypothetical protein M1368_05495 [Thaumarchaeota archaeon]|nr:hypothetical protein [Nitrososphaerota archaeon]